MSTMNKLLISEIDCEDSLKIDEIEKLLERNVELQFINILNWKEYSYKPEVKFRIAYCQDQILLKYYINEESIMAKQTKTNDDVYRDSCVEFFISPNQNDTYYNFEFNCIGVCHASYGKVGSEKTLIGPQILNLISIKSSLGNQPFHEKRGGHQWEMMIMIPKKCLVFDENIVLKGLISNANFYKCGDDTSKPHFLSWNPIITEIPDFHQPKYFGELVFN